MFHKKKLPNNKIIHTYIYLVVFICIRTNIYIYIPSFLGRIKVRKREIIKPIEISSMIETGSNTD